MSAAAILITAIMFAVAQLNFTLVLVEVSRRLGLNSVAVTTRSVFSFHSASAYSGGSVSSSGKAGREPDI
jgi:hypothetical protein